MSALSDLQGSTTGKSKPTLAPALSGLDALRQVADVTPEDETELTSPKQQAAPIIKQKPLVPLIPVEEESTPQQTIEEINDETGLSVVPDVVEEIPDVKEIDAGQTIAEINDETGMSVVPDAFEVSEAHETTMIQLRKDQVTHDDKRTFIERQELRSGVGNVRMRVNDAFKNLEVIAQKKRAWESEDFAQYPLELPSTVHIPGFMQQLEFDIQTPERKEELRAAALTLLKERKATIDQDFLDARAVLADEEIAPTHPVMKALHLAQKADDQALVNAIIVEFPLITLAEVALPSIAQGGFPQILAPMGAAIAVKTIGGVTAVARAAYVAAGGVVSEQIEFNAAMYEFFTDKGIDMSDIEQLSLALDDPELVAEAKNFANKRSIPIAVLDMFSMYLATKMFIPPILKGKVVRQIANGLTQFTQETILGGLGELAAQVTAEQDINQLEIKLEMIGGAQSTPTDIAMFAIANRLGIPPKKMSTTRTAIDTILANKEITELEAVRLLQEVADKGMSFAKAYKLLQNFTFGKQALTNRHNELQTNDFVHGAEARTELEESMFTDSEGNLLQGADLIQIATNGKVYWHESGTDPDSNSLSAELARAEFDVQFTALELDIAKSQGDTVATINMLEERLSSYKLNAENITETQKLLVEAKPAMQTFMQDLVKRFIPNRSVLIIERNTEFDDRNEGLYGYAGTLDAMRLDGSIQKSAVIYINVRQIATVYASSQNNVDTVGKPRLSLFMGVLGHEFGHVLLRHYTATLPKPVQEALYAEHRDWIAERFAEGKVTLDAMLNSKQNPAMHAELADGEKSLSAFSKKRNTYNLGFNEWIADGISRLLANKESTVSPTVRKHLPRLAKVMEKLYDTVKSRFKSDSTLDTFMKYIEARAVRESLTKIKENLSEHELDAPIGSQNANILTLVENSEMNIPKDLKDEINNSLDKYNWISKWGYTLLQLAKDNPHIAGLQNYIKAVHGHWITKSSWNDQAMQTMNAWRALGGKANDLGRFLLELTIASDELQRKLNPEEVTALLKEKGIDFGDQSAAVFKVYERIEGDLQNALTEIERIEQERIRRDYVDSPTNMINKLTELSKTFKEIRNRNYFPLTRFGKFAVTVRAKKSTVIDGTPYKKGEVAHFELYENVKQRDKAFGTLRREFGNSFTLEPSILEDDLQSFTGLPMAIFRSLKDNTRLGLTPEQKTRLQEMIDNMSPANNIAKRMLRRKGVKGFNLNAQRGYAMYMMNLSSHIAKMRHAGEMDAAIEEVRHSSKYLTALGVQNDKRHQILEHLKKHKDYIFDSGNEWSGLRAFGFHWYLGFNVKSAMVNLTQVPLVAYPYFAARKSLLPAIGGISDAIVIKELVIAMKDVMGIYAGRDSINPQIAEGLSILQAEGIIDESLATEIAGQAHGEVLSSILPAETLVGDVTKRAVNQVLHFSPMIFQTAEKINRRVVAVTAMRLAEKVKPGDQKFAIDEAREALRSTQFEYARWNRAAFMRGKASVLFLFMQYLQNVLFFMMKDPGKWRFLFMLFLAAGLQGLPGAEDILDVVDFATMKIRKLTGWKDPRFDSRQALREYIIKLGLDPDLIMHGAASQSMGLGTRQFSEWSGISLPNVSMDGSLNMGRIIPGINYVAKGGERSGHQVLSAAQNIAGAAYSIPINFFLWARDNDPNTLRAFERIMPSAIANISKAYRWTNDGGVYDRTGEQIVEFNPANSTHMMELGAKVLGFQPSRVQFAYESRYAKTEAAKFYSASRQVLTGVFFYAMDTNNTEGIAASKEAIRKWNARVDGTQKITGLGSLYAQHKIKNMKGEAGLSDRLYDIPLFRDIDPLYPAAQLKSLGEAKTLKNINPYTLDESIK